MSLDTAIDHLLGAKRISAASQSYAKDNPIEARGVFEYLRGGARPVGVLTEMGLGLIEVEDERRGVEPEPPAGTVALWGAPVLTDAEQRTVTDSARTVPRGTGRDLRLAVSGTLNGNIGQIEAYGDVDSRNGVLRNGSSNSSGHIIPRENVEGVFHLEGWNIDLTVPADAVTARWRTRIVQHIGCDIAVTDAGTSFHSDCFQTQEAILDELRYDLCTLRTDYQGIFLSNEAQNQGPARSRVDRTIISRTNFRRGRQGIPATYLFKAWPPRPNADPIGPVELYDVWAPDPAICYPWTTFRSWAGGDMTYGSFMETRRHRNGNTYPFLRFSTSSDIVPVGAYKGQPCGDCMIRGDGGIWVHPADGDPPIPEKDYSKVAYSPPPASQLVLAAVREAPAEVWRPEVTIAKPDYPDLRFLSA
jgi:hypothetical protein